MTIAYLAIAIIFVGCILIYFMGKNDAYDELNSFLEKEIPTDGSYKTLSYKEYQITIRRAV